MEESPDMISYKDDERSECIAKLIDLVGSSNYHENIDNEFEEKLKQSRYIDYFEA